MILILDYLLGQELRASEITGSSVILIEGITKETRDRSFIGVGLARPADQVDHLGLAYTNDVTPVIRSAR